METLVGTPRLTACRWSPFAGTVASAQSTPRRGLGLARRNPEYEHGSLSLECSKSPSRNEQFVAFASISPMVVFPDPATPITTMIIGRLLSVAYRRVRVF